MITSPIDLNKKLSFIPFSNQRSYGFLYQKDSILIQYEIEVYFIKRNPGEFIVVIDRKHLHINDRKPDLLMDQFAHECGKALFPIKILLTGNNKINFTTNVPEIKERWEQIRSKIQHYYVGELAEKLINKIDPLYKDVHSLNQALQHSWFFRLFFSPLYLNYKVFQAEPEKPWFLPDKNNKLTPYHMKYRMQEKYSPSGKIIVDALGEGTSGKTAHLEYRLYKEDHTLFSVKGIFMDENQNNLTKIEICHLKERTYKNSFLYTEGDNLNKTKEKEGKSSKGLFIDEKPYKG